MCRKRSDSNKQAKVEQKEQDVANDEPEEICEEPVKAKSPAKKKTPAKASTLSKTASPAKAKVPVTKSTTKAKVKAAPAPEEEEAADENDEDLEEGVETVQKLSLKERMALFEQKNKQANET